MEEHGKRIEDLEQALNDFRSDIDEHQVCTEKHCKIFSNELQINASVRATMIMRKLLKKALLVNVLSGKFNWCSR